MLLAADRYNAEVNGVGNIFLARMSSEEFTETWRIKGSRRRLEGLVWDELNLKVRAYLGPQPVAGCCRGCATLWAVSASAMRCCCLHVQG
jgi:hypothetical protein